MNALSAPVAAPKSASKNNPAAAAAADQCGTCERKKPSALAGYGYCGSAPSVEQRARFVPDAQECWIPETLRPRQRGG
jgi:hypothetical protein